MPQRIGKACNHPGCPTTVIGKPYCDKHKRTKEDNRESSTQRGYDRKWRNARRQYLKQHPLCVQCLDENKTTVATVVDHKIPHKGDYHLFWNVNNWRALCKACHDRDTVLYDGGFGNEVKPKPKD